MAARFPARRALLPPPLDDDEQSNNSTNITTVTSSLNTGRIGGAGDKNNNNREYYHPSSSEHSTRNSSQPPGIIMDINTVAARPPPTTAVIPAKSIRRNHLEEQDRGGVSTGTRRSKVLVDAHHHASSLSSSSSRQQPRNSDNNNIAATIDSYLIENDINWNGGAHRVVDGPLIDLVQQQQEQEDGTNNNNVIGGTVESQSSRTQREQQPQNGNTASRTYHQHDHPQGRRGRNHDDVMPLLASVAMLDAAIRRNQKVLSSGEMPFKPTSIDHRARNGDGSTNSNTRRGGPASTKRRYTGNDLKEELLETLVITERALDRHYSCPSDLKILAGIARGGGHQHQQGSPSTTTTTHHSYQQEPNSGGRQKTSGFVWLQSPHALGPRSGGVISNAPLVTVNDQNEVNNRSNHVAAPLSPRREEVPSQPVVVAFGTKTATTAKIPITNNSQFSSVVDCTPVRRTACGDPQRQPTYNRFATTHQCPATPSPLPVQPEQFKGSYSLENEKSREEEDGDDDEEPRLIH